MNDTKRSLAKLAIAQLSRTERMTLLHELGLVAPGTEPTKSEVRLIRREEAAKRLAVCVRTIDKLAKSGVLRRRLLPGRRRSCGFLLSDIESLIAAQPVS
jgi:predicted DNA-binding transcriptional regulator AlpA